VLNSKRGDQTMRPFADAPSTLGGGRCIMTPCGHSKFFRSPLFAASRVYLAPHDAPFETKLYLAVWRIGKPNGSASA
jgi:hypothetical protein